MTSYCENMGLVTRRGTDTETGKTLLSIGNVTFSKTPHRNKHTYEPDCKYHSFVVESY